MKKLTILISIVIGCSQVSANNETLNFITGKRLKDINMLHYIKDANCEIKNKHSRVLNPEKAKIIEIEHLDCSERKIHVINKNIKYLMELKTVDFSKNKILVAPYELAELKQLKILDLSGNDLTNTISIIPLLKYVELLRYDETSKERSLDRAIKTKEDEQRYKNVLAAYKNRTWYEIDWADMANSKGDVPVKKAFEKIKYERYIDRENRVPVRFNTAILSYQGVSAAKLKKYIDYALERGDVTELAALKAIQGQRNVISNDRIKLIKKMLENKSQKDLKEYFERATDRGDRSEMIIISEIQSSREIFNVATATRLMVEYKDSSKKKLMEKFSSAKQKNDITEIKVFGDLLIKTKLK